MDANYEISTHVINSTDSATLYFGVDRCTREAVGIKTYEFTTTDPIRTCRELSVIKRLSHPHLLRFFNYYESNQQTKLVSELPQQELIQYIIEKKYYCEDDCRSIINQIVDAIYYLHEFNAPHLNLKSSNLLVLNGKIKLSDYAMCGLIPEEKRLYSVAFMAPEQLLEQDFTNEPDIYSIGLITYLLLTGKLPFKQFNNLKDLLIGKLNYQFELQQASVSADAFDFIRRCLQPINRRISIKQLMKHPWLHKEVPVVPLNSTQQDLRRFLALVKVQGGTQVCLATLRQLINAISNEIEDDQTDNDQVDEEDLEADEE